MRTYKLPLISWTDTVFSVVIAIMIAMEYSIPAGLFAFSVMQTLDQIFWTLCGKTKEMPYRETTQNQ